MNTSCVRYILLYANMLWKDINPSPNINMRKIIELVSGKIIVILQILLMKYSRRYTEHFYSVLNYPQRDVIS